MTGKYEKHAASYMIKGNIMQNSGIKAANIPYMHISAMAKRWSDKKYEKEAAAMLTRSMMTEIVEKITFLP